LADDDVFCSFSIFNQRQDEKTSSSAKGRKTFLKQSNTTKTLNIIRQQKQKIFASKSGGHFASF